MKLLRNDYFAQNAPEGGSIIHLWGFARLNNIIVMTYTEIQSQAALEAFAHYRS